MPIIDPPHPDIELCIARSPYNYNIAIPSGGITDNTGLILYIHGFGSSYNDEYTKKLLPYLANTYDCLSVSVDYHGAWHMHNNAMKPSPDFFLNLNKYHGVSAIVSDDLDRNLVAELILEQMAERGVTELHQECTFINLNDGYNNFGVLSALDNLQTISEVLKTYKINKKRIFAIGTSYGGYVALLMAKFAPNTFRMAIDNSGFSSSDDCMGVIYGFSGKNHPLKVTVRSRISFNNTIGSRHYFGESRRIIRDLGTEIHYEIPSSTVMYSYHSVLDKIAPTSSKIRISDIIKKQRNYDLRLIHENDIDGHVFKNMNHGMSASMRGLFDLSYKRWLSCGAIETETTDFELGTINRLICDNEEYTICFDEKNGVRASITNAALADHAEIP